MSSALTTAVRLARAHPSHLVIGRELAAARHPRHVTYGLVGGGHLQLVAPAVFRPTVVPEHPLAAAWLPVRYAHQVRGAPDAAHVTAQAALAAYGTEGFELPKVPLVRSEARLGASGASWRVRRGRVAHEHRSLAQRLPVACPGLALADAAEDPAVEERRLRVGIDSTRWLGHSTLAELLAVWQALAGVHTGARRLLALARTGMLDRESEGERVTWSRLFVPHGPLPDCQVWLTPRRRVDFVFLAAGLVLEYLGSVHEGQLEEDAERSWELASLGYELILLTRGLLRRDPAGLATVIHQRRREREDLARRGLLRLAPLPEQPPRRVPLRTLHPTG